MSGQALAIALTLTALGGWVLGFVLGVTAMHITIKRRRQR